MMKMIRKWWFYITLPVLLIATLVFIDGKKELKAYDDYIFYGIAQNKISDDGGRLRVNFIVKGFPERRHSVYVEVINHHGEVDFLYSEEHTKSHKAHYAKDGVLRKYLASYVIPGTLKPGKYKLRVTFEFDTPGWGRLNRDKLISNSIKFEIKK